MQVALVMLERQHAVGRYPCYLPVLADSLMNHLGLNESDVFFNRVRVYARQVGRLMVARMCR